MGPHPGEKHLPSSGTSTETVAAKAQDSFPTCVKRDAILVAQHCDQAGEDTEGGYHVIFPWRTQPSWGFIPQQHKGQGCHTA